MKRRLLLILAAAGLTGCSNLTAEQNGRLMELGLRVAEQKLLK